MTSKRIFWGLIFLLGVWITMSEKPIGYLGIIIGLIALSFGLREIRKEKK